ncbi:HNH endonuclease [Blastococcus brunescens]|uniref:HNH endonuclease n=1 Tax=Blastococcus brunescens TaxID=1564165 RepID=UPI003BEEDD6D
MTREQLVNWGLAERGGDGCWYWRGRPASRADGYVTVRDAGTNRMIDVHRLVYETIRGPIPAGYVIDHTCHGPECTAKPCPHRACCHPDHLAAVPAKENNAAHRRRPRGNTCKRGHDLADAYVDKRGARHCRICANDRQRESSVRSEVDGRARKDGQCANGHRIAEVGLTAAGRCRECHREAQRTYKARQRARH